MRQEFISLVTLIFREWAINSVKHGVFGAPKVRRPLRLKSEVRFSVERIHQASIYLRSNNPR